MVAGLVRAARDEWFLAVSAGTGAVFLGVAPTIEHALSGPTGLAFLSLWLFAVLLGSCLSVVRHADHLAARMGEPYGTLILTLAVTFIEVMSISAMSGHGQDNPALVRDTIFAVVMILLNGMVGISLLLGAWRHREQQYNLQGANAYLGAIIPLTVLSLILPNFTRTAPGPTLSTGQEIFVALVSIGLYATFLAVQTVRHRSYFALAERDDVVDEADHAAGAGHPLRHAALLIAYMAPLVFLAEELGRPVGVLLQRLEAPAALGGVVIALLVATPEALGAVRAAAANRLQRSMNIFLGSVLSTIGLTIPAMIALSWHRGEKIVLGLQDADALMLVLTLVVSVVTFSSGRTNLLQGAIHLVLFGAYIMLIFQG